jgi:Fe-S cluster biogenesis protein NfuA
MTNPPESGEFQTKLNRLETLIQQAERLVDPAARTCARELVQALLELHALGLGRLLDRVASMNGAGESVLAACTADEIISGLLLLHGLHPLGLEERVRQAIERLEPQLRKREVEIELLGVDDDIVQLRVDPSRDGCPSTLVSLRKVIEESVYAFAPDVLAIEIEGLEAPPSLDAAERFALPVL